MASLLSGNNAREAANPWGAARARVEWLLEGVIRRPSLLRAAPSEVALKEQSEKHVKVLLKTRRVKGSHLVARVARRLPLKESLATRRDGRLKRPVVIAGLFVRAHCENNLQNFPELVQLKMTCRIMVLYFKKNI
ncbi:hypothetical protein NDU88_011805 [Pleurodeles waltl]|uniref:Uncharacterized protein n=1 Tax=Pleurodeles waltl TaxID=8319 RepID=A0AAV7R2R7_PLEWA|nr:hypothetical protein NDU88_011805 [Pleurodeles waltl]